MLTFYNDYGVSVLWVCAMKCCMRFVCVFVCVCPAHIHMEPKQKLIKRLVELVVVLFLRKISIKSSRNGEVAGRNGGWMLREMVCIPFGLGRVMLFLYVCMYVCKL